MHRHDDSIEVLTQAIVRYVVDRLRLDPPPLDGPRITGRTAAPWPAAPITPEGIGGLEALRIYGDVLGPACISVDHPRFLSFVPAAPTEASILFDLVVGASSVYAGSWLEGGGAIFAENEALRWIADLVGLPDDGRRGVRQRRHGRQPQRPDRGTVELAASRRRRLRPHARADRRIVGRPFVGRPGGAGDGRRRRARAGRRARPADRIGVARHGRGAVRRADRDRLFAIVATAGTTNVGVVDDLAGAAAVTAELGTWMHVDGAYGGAALAAPSVRAAVRRHRARRQLHRRPAQVAVRTVRLLRTAVPRPGDRPGRPHAARGVPRRAARRAIRPTSRGTPADYAHHLSRRARGLPLWFSLATHGTDAYSEAVETTLPRHPRGRRSHRRPRPTPNS